MSRKFHCSSCGVVNNDPYSAEFQFEEGAQWTCPSCEEEDSDSNYDDPDDLPEHPIDPLDQDGNMVCASCGDFMDFGGHTVDCPAGVQFMCKACDKEEHGSDDDDDDDDEDEDDEHDYGCYDW